MSDDVLPAADVERVRRWAEDRTPPEFRDRTFVDVEVGATSLTVVECSHMGDQTGWLRVASALLWYSSTAQEWALYRFDSDSFPHVYEFLKPGPKIQGLLDEIAADPTFIFWG